MNLIPDRLSNKAHRAGLHARKHAPTGMFVTGILGTVASTVLACRATLKLEAELDDIQHEIAMVKGETEKLPGFEPDAKDIYYVYAKSLLRIGKLYGPSVLVGAASVGLLTGSHVTLQRRNAQLSAAYAAIQAAYEEYRDRVREEVGEERELELYHAATIADCEDEEGKKVKEAVADPSAWSPYARFFDESCSPWVRNAETNRLYVLGQQNYANHLLNARGHVFLNEVYDMFGIPHTKAGQVVGWVLDGEGDGHIDFGLFNARNADFMNARERSILLDFNVDGVVYDKI